MRACVRTCLNLGHLKKIGLFQYLTNMRNVHTLADAHLTGRDEARPAPPHRITNGFAIGAEEVLTQTVFDRV